MKNLYSFLFIFCSVILNYYFSIAGEDLKNQNDVLRKSQFGEYSSVNNKSGFPMPYSFPNNPVNYPAISTGYYFVDSDDESPDLWRPSPEIIDTNYEKILWRRILPGPRILSRQYWIGNSSDGLRFFRNPALPGSGGDFFTDPTDSADDAIAGPMPIGFKFYFNGIRYDSFYVGTNGIIALTNRRYFYDNLGNRVIPITDSTCYDPMSMDWFVRKRTGDGLNDTTPDNYGYLYAVLNGNPGDSTAGIRARGGDLGGENSPWGVANRLAVISPFFGDLHLSQYNIKTKKAEDWGKVYYKYFKNNDKLIIYFINITPFRELNTPCGTYWGDDTLRPGDKNYLSASAQVVLDSKDSSVLVVYERFEGYALFNNRGITCNTVFRYNTTAGVRGYARHINYGQPGGSQSPWSDEYEQYTYYYRKDSSTTPRYPHNFLAIKFKQWKNLLRICDIQYRVRRPDRNANNDFTETVSSLKTNNYEILAGEEKIGAVQPVAIFQNISNNIQGPNGINFQEQNLNFKVKAWIINEASGKTVYSRVVNIDSTCLAQPLNNTTDCQGNPDIRVNYCIVTNNEGNWETQPLSFPGKAKLNGIPPSGFVQVFFPPFEPDEHDVNNIGRLKLNICTEPFNPFSGQHMTESWPFDDSSSVTLFVMKRLSDIYDDFSSFHSINRIPMPTTQRWVNINAEVVSGDEVSKHPLPPRGEFSAANNKDFNFKTPDYTTYKLSSPALRMNRLTLERTEPVPPSTGDEIRSFPINLVGRYGTVLTVSFQRGRKQDDWPRGWSDQQLVGMEPRTIINGDVFSLWNYQYSASNPPDEIAVEIMQPSPDRVSFITNVPESRWRNHPRRKGAAPVTNMPAYSLYGGGGYIRGFFETDKDSALSMPGGGRLNGLRPDVYDDGIDFEYKKAVIPIPDTIIKSMNEGAKNFRFRIKMYATNHKKCYSCIPDDDDPVFIDNIYLEFPMECMDMEMSSVKAIWPYTIAPASQATKIPVSVKVFNSTSVDAPTFLVKLKIIPQGKIHPTYCRIDIIPFVKPGQEAEIIMPYWNARSTGPGLYRLAACIIVPGGDLWQSNDTTYTDFRLNFGDVYAYDPAQSPRNDVPDQAFTGIPGRGLNLFAFAIGGEGSIDGPSGKYDENNSGAGYVGGSGSGQIAVKFRLNQQDTIYGFKAFFGTLCAAANDISLAIYSDRNGPAAIIKGSLIYKIEGYDDIRKEFLWDEYVTYLLPKPLVLDYGYYWAAISQLGESGLGLGASKTRMGMRTTNISIKSPFNFPAPVGEQGIHVLLDKTFRKSNISGNLINDNYFALENTRGSGNWVSFMPNSGNPGFAHLHHFGISPADGLTATLSRGSWVPMLRPYFKSRSYGSNLVYEECDDDVSVELTNFVGFSRIKCIDLLWETASELNNRGFYIEKRNSCKESDNWQNITFVKGAGTSKNAIRYSFSDRDVTNKTQYSYRLRQVDMDGSVTCESESPVVSVYYDSEALLDLRQNSPNPVTKGYTVISFIIPADGDAKLEVLDIFGNFIVNIHEGKCQSGMNEFPWNCLGSRGLPVPAGTYIYRLTYGENIKTGKMTIIR